MVVEAGQDTPSFRREGDWETMQDVHGAGHRQRRLAWEGCLNVRDLGGYPTADGRGTRWGAVIRADNLATLTGAGRAALVASGVRTIVDLRAPDETAAHPNPFARPGGHGVAYVHVPFIDPTAGPPPPFTTLADSYGRMLDRFRSGVAAIMTTIARAEEGGVLVHCMGGKDRTGLVSALLLDLAGVPRETVGADYALTAECLRPLDEEYLATGPGTRAEREQELGAFMPRAAVMIEVLDRLDRDHGGAQAYLEHAGVARTDVERLRARLLRPAPVPA
jgi:protein-tyrosine phosphatase